MQWGRGCTASGVPAHFRVRFRSHFRVSFLVTFSLAVRPHTRASCAINWYTPAPTAHFFTKTEQMFCFESAASPHFFPYSEKFFRPPPPPLDTIRNNSRILVSGLRPLVSTAPAPTLFLFVLSVSRAPHFVGAHFGFACPPAGAK